MKFQWQELWMKATRMALEYVRIGAHGFWLSNLAIVNNWLWLASQAKLVSIWFNTWWSSHKRPFCLPDIFSFVKNLLLPLHPSWLHPYSHSCSLLPCMLLDLGIPVNCCDHVVPPLIDLQHVSLQEIFLLNPISWQQWWYPSSSSLISTCHTILPPYLLSVAKKCLPD